MKPLTSSENAFCFKKMHEILGEDKNYFKGFYDADDLSRLMEDHEDQMPKSIKTTWNLFDTFFGGFRPREFTILCGSTGVGKTEFLVNLSNQFMKTGTKQIVWSVETGAIDFGKRLYGVVSKKDFHSKERITKEEFKNFNETYGVGFSNSGIYFSPHENRIPSDKLFTDLIYAREYLGCEVAILDNLNYFLEVTSAANQLIETDRVLHNLILLCKNIDMHLIMVMHPKKTDNGKVNSEFDIKGSSTAVQEAHNVLLLNRYGENEGYKADTNTTRVLTFQKMRRRGMHVGKRIAFVREDSVYVEGVNPL